MAPKAAAAQRIAAIDAIVNRARYETRDIAALIECLGDSSKLVQRRAAEALARVHAGGVSVIEPLRRSLTSLQERQRWGAAFALSLIDTPPPAALPAILEALGNDDSDLRWAACDLLLRIADPAVVAEGIRRLLASTAVSQRRMAGYCVRRLAEGAMAFVPELLRLLDDSDPSVRLAALAGLGSCHAAPREVAGRIIAALEDGDLGVRRAAAATLGSLSTSLPEVVEALQHAAAAADPGLKRAAQRSLQQLRALGS